MFPGRQRRAAAETAALPLLVGSMNMPTAKFTSRTKWRAKLEKLQERAVGQLTGKMRERLGEGTLLIPTPLDVDAMIRNVPRGRLITTPRLREALARQFKATTACPLCTGIFTRIAAETAEEDAAAGVKTITPYWRVLTDDGRLNPKFPGGVEAQARRLRGEGHQLIRHQGKKPPQVRDFEKKLAML